MPEFVRVKDKTTGHEFTVLHPNLDKVAVIDKPAVGRNGRPLPAKPRTTVAQASAKKETKSPGDEHAKNLSKEGPK